MFQFYMPTKVIIGRECVVKEGHLLKGIGNKALIVTGRYSAKKNGSLKDVVKALERRIWLTVCLMKLKKIHL